MTPSYNDAINMLLSLVDHERSVPSLPRQKRIYDLKSVERLLSRMGDPHRRSGIIHVAGTKGKGSTAAMVESILRAAGYSTGFYSSPHLHSFCERIRLNGSPIAQDQFAELVDAVWPFHMANTTDPDAGPATLFEFLTAMAFRYFSERETDFSVIEVGLGGRLDATNVVTPEISVITPVSMDHMAILGDTIAAIATEKAGIIKPGVPVVVAPQFPEAAAVISQTAAARNSPVVQVGDTVKWETRGESLKGQSLTIHGRLGTYETTIPLLGDFQGANAAAAVAAVETLSQKEYDITARSITEGLSVVGWPCRLEVLGLNPTVIADGAHNDHSVAAILSTVGAYSAHRRLVVVAGFSRDKQVESMVKLFARHAHCVVATRSRHPRSMAPSEIADMFIAAGMTDRQVLACSDVAHAVEEALTLASPDDLVLVAGSLFVAAEVREKVLGIKPEEYPDLLAPDLRQSH